MDRYDPPLTVLAKEVEPNQVLAFDLGPDHLFHPCQGCTIEDCLEDRVLHSRAKAFQFLVQSRPPPIVRYIIGYHNEGLPLT